jgi:hypothetical protein
MSLSPLFFFLLLISLLLLLVVVVVVVEEGARLFIDFLVSSRGEADCCFAITELYSWRHA